MILRILAFSTCLWFGNAEWNTKDYLKREHSLVKPYQGSGVMLPYWDFLGSTIVTSSYIRLTPDLQGKAGAIWNSVPCKVRNWELQIQFKVSGKGKDLFGDGFMVWYTKERMKPGPVFGSKDFFTGLAISVDTYSNQNGAHNHQHPYISAMLNNGSKHYDHDKDGTHLQLAGCESKFRNFDKDTYMAIRYTGDELKVFTDFDGKNAWKPCLEVPGVKLPTGYFFGVSAATGDLSDNHDIIAFKLYSLDMPGDEDKEDRSEIIPSAEFFEAPRGYRVTAYHCMLLLARLDATMARQDATGYHYIMFTTDHVDDIRPSSSLQKVKTFFLFLIIALVLVVVAVGGVMLYQNWKKEKSKRFY